MRIAQVTPLWLEVPPRTYGGTEYIISLLTEELIRKGHEVTLFATSDSQTKAKLVPVWPKGLFRDTNVADASAVCGLLYKELLDRQGDFDIIHDHGQSYGVPFSKFLKPPIVNTIHNIFTEEEIILYKKFPNINYVAISSNHKKSGHGVNIAKTIYHGIPIEKYKFNLKPKDYLLWLSNIAPDKGLAEAIEIAKMAGEKLIISGTIFPKNADYFEYRIKPLIDGKQVKFIGASNLKKKNELFKDAKAFLFPIFKRREPFGLVVIEAMACGTPVIAAASGAMPELIENRKTGFLVKNKEEALSALKRINSISREYCRQYIENNFSLRRMVNRYERLYKKILNQQKNKT